MAEPFSIAASVIGASKDSQKDLQTICDDFYEIVHVLESLKDSKSRILHQTPRQSKMMKNSQLLMSRESSDASY